MATKREEDPDLPEKKRARVVVPWSPPPPTVIQLGRTAAAPAEGQRRPVGGVMQYGTCLDQQRMRRASEALAPKPGGSFGSAAMRDSYPYREVGAVSFALPSPAEIRRTAACQVTRANGNAAAGDANTPSDPRLGAAAGRRCDTCFHGFAECPGHAGYVKLRPFVSHVQAENVRELLKCICPFCRRVRLPEAFLQMGAGKGGRRAQHDPEWLKRAAQTSSRKMQRCFRCGAVRVEFKLVFGRIEARVGGTVAMLHGAQIRHILVRVPDSDYRLLGLDPDDNHPANAVMTHVPVIPPLARPADRPGGGSGDTVAGGGRRSAHQGTDDALTSLCSAMAAVATQAQLERDPAKAAELQLQAEQLWEQGTLNKLPPTALRRGNKAGAGGGIAGALGCLGGKVASIRHRHCRKYGRFRRHLMGKRTRSAFRTVQTCKSIGACHRVRVPSSLVGRLSVPHVVLPWNRDAIARLCRRGGVVRVQRGDSDVSRAYGRMARLALRPNAATDVLLRDGCRLPVPLEAAELVPTDRVLRTGPDGGVCELRADGNTEPPQLPVGSVVWRSAGDGDRCVINRQPTLVVESVLGVEIETELGVRGHVRATALPVEPESDVPPVPEDLSIKVPLQVQEKLRGDCDGDELTGHMAFGPEERAELPLVSVIQRIVSSQKSEPAGRLIHDPVAVMCMLTHRPAAARPVCLPDSVRAEVEAVLLPPDPRIEPAANPRWLEQRRATVRRTWEQLCAAQPGDPFVRSVLDHDLDYLTTGPGLLSLVVPADLTYTGPSAERFLPALPDDAPPEAVEAQRQHAAPLRIWRGVVLDGWLRAPALSHGKGCVVQRLYTLHGPGIAARFMDNVAAMTALLGRQVAYCVTLEDCLLPPSVRYELDRGTEQAGARVVELHRARLRAGVDTTAWAARCATAQHTALTGTETLLSSYLCCPVPLRWALIAACREAEAADREAERLRLSGDDEGAARVVAACPAARHRPRLLVAPTPEQYAESVRRHELRRAVHRDLLRTDPAARLWPDRERLDPDDYGRMSESAFLVMLGMKINNTQLVRRDIGMGQQIPATGNLPVGPHGRVLTHYAHPRRALVVLSHNDAQAVHPLQNRAVGWYAARRVQLDPTESDERMLEVLRYHGLILTGGLHRGLAGEEWFAHSVIGRESVANINTLTGKIGYQMRSAVKMVESTRVEWDGTVRDHTNRVVQFQYGTGGFDMRWCCHTADCGKQFVDVRAMADMFRARAALGAPFARLQAAGGEKAPGTQHGHEPGAPLDGVALLCSA